MLLETALALMYSKKRQKENFVEEEVSNKEKTIAWTWFDIVYMIFGISWAILFILLWLRIVYLAFSCGVGEGVASLFFSSHYTLYKFGDLIKVSCNAY